MKNVNKNSTWWSLTFITLLLFIIALYVIGFQIGDTFLNLDNFVGKIKEDDTPSYIVTSYGLFVSSLIFIAIDVCLVISKWTMDELNVKTKMPNKYWDYLFLAIVVLGSILLISGAALFINKIQGDIKLNPTLLYPDSSRSAGLFILVILTIPMNMIPLFIPNDDEKPLKSNVEISSK